MLCQRKDSYTDSVYSKDTLGTLLTISQRFHFSEFPFTDLIFYGIDPLLTVQEYVELSMSGSTGERSFADIITCIRYGVIHNKPIPSLFTLLDELRGLVIRQHGFSLRCIWKPSSKRVFYRESTRNSINNWPF